MVGSGTALVEAALLGRHAIGVDIDPLSYCICKAKTDKLSPTSARNTLSDILYYLNFHLTPLKAKEWMQVLPGLAWVVLGAPLPSERCVCR